ncbi:MAG: SPASM domain-containing protein, partial [Xanthobacteraceae bacterium]
TTANKMDQYFETNFSWLRDHNPEFVPNRANSWHSYDFFIAPVLVDNLRQQMRNILDRVWRTRVRFQPELDLDEVREFVLGSEKPAQRRTRCLSVARRLNVMPDGGVTTCKLFPEFRVGTLNDRSVAEIWHSVIAAQTRSKLADSLTPVCSKCVQLYLHSP